MNGFTRIAGLLLLIGGLGLPALSAPDSGPADDPLLAQTTRFCTLFLNGEQDAASEMMSEEMKTSFPKKMMQQVLDATLQGSDAWKLGDPWLEAVQSGFRRYRIPLQLDGGPIDLRVVFDDSGKVAGFFRTSHTEPTPEKEAHQQRALPGFVGHWEGNLEIPGSPLQVIVDLAFTDGYWSGTVGIPAQGAQGLPLERFQPGDDGSLSFSIANIPGDPTFHGKLEDGALAGTFTQSTASFPFRLTHKKSAGPNRPQEPKPPFPYDQAEVVFKNGDVSLAGTLTLPKGDGPFPAVLLVSGSGPQDRNEEVFNHKPFLVIADHLTRAGIAVLRYDDRGVGKSTGGFSMATSEDFRNDALAGVRFLHSRDKIDPGKVGILGHSEGGIIAPMAAAESEDVAFIILLAGPGVPGSEIITHQMGLLLNAAGTPEATVTRIQAAQKQVIDLLMAGAPEDEIKAAVTALLQAQQGGKAPDRELVEQQLLQLQSPWYRFFLEFDPRTVLHQVNVPVLALNGEKDLQVDPSQNLPEIEKALKKAGNKDVTLREFPGLNHLFQKAETGSPQEYYSIEETIDPTVLDTIRDWILERFGPKKAISASPNPPG